MLFPEKPTCHGDAPSMATRPVQWIQDAEAGVRKCSYCGSIHPEDLLRVLKAGASLTGSDWKYGWPHKFYLDRVPNPKAGQTAVISTLSRPLEEGEEIPEGATFEGEFTALGGGKIRRVSIPTYGPAPQFLMLKWYNAHLLDQGFDEEAFAALQDALKSSGIEFWIEAETGRLMYRAPYHGFQKPY